MKKLLLLFCLFAILTPAMAQDFTFGDINQDEVDMVRYSKDTSAHAVVLKEFGKAFISSGDHIPLIFEYHTKIKFFDSQAFEDHGNIEIKLHKMNSDRFESISDIEAITYYKDDNGMLQKSELNSKQIFHIKGTKNYDIVRFAMPNLHKGCIIEYKYRIESPYIFNFKTWVFQSDIPKMYSEYEAHLPAVYNYNVSLRGGYKLTKNKAELERECFSVNGIKSDCSKITYAMANVPAFVEESMMTAPSNFISAIYFELSDYTDLGNGTNIKVTKDWKDIDYQLKHDDQVGGQMKRKDLFKERLPAVIANKTDELQKAKAVFEYLQKSIKWDGSQRYWSEDGIKKALENHGGSSGDINLALVAALSYAGINTEAVLLSTREYGIVNKLYPVVSDFNYVIAKANIGDKSYLLDATDPLLPFGLLPIRCINDQGRVISLDKPSYWMDMVASQKRSSTYALDLTLMDNGKIKGTMNIYSSGYKAYEKRLAIKKFNSTDEYVENLDEKLTKIKILKSEITNLDSLEKPLSEYYEIEIDAFSSLDKNKLSFNPFYFDKLDENPFKLTERSYPVDFGSASDEKFILNMHLPAQFMVETSPKPINIVMPNQGGRFMTNYDVDTNGFTFSHVTQVNHAIYSPEEYPYLKELFNKIILSEKAEIVFKRK